KTLGDQIQTLTSNKDSLETYAREQFYFAEPGETVYLIEE
ncbi:MAG: septum formation initiator family protein, partial [Bacteroidales bacterium]|nr:septum formation initiator family protein [Bacteroidales bacterium]